MTTHNSANALIHIGTIVRPHGIGGELQVEMHAPAQLIPGIPVWIGYSPTFAKLYTLESVTYAAKRCILGISTIKSRRDAEALREQGIFIEPGRIHIPRLLPPSGLIGWNVYTQHRQLVGTITAIEDNPAHPLLHLCCINGAEALIPYVEEFVTESNLSERILVIAPPDGLLPL